MKPFRSLSLLILSLAGLSGALPAQAAKEEGRFHLVYLVSTDRVEPGATAYVEPLFFTDGNRLVFAYDYCRQYYQRQHNKPETAYPRVLIRKEDLIYPNQIASDLKAIHTYCNGEETRIDFSKYVVRDSAGVRLAIENVQFPRQTAFDSLAQGMVLPPVFPARGTATIRSADGRPALLPEATIEGGQQYFFLAADAALILDRIAPVPEIKAEEVAALKKQIRDYAQRRVGAPNNNETFKECDLGHPFDPGFAKWKGSYRLEHMQLLAASVADLDRDGHADAIVSLKEYVTKARRVKPLPGSTAEIHGSTTEIRLVYGNGQSQCFAWSPGIPKESFPILQPLAFVWVGGKGYLITTQSGEIDNESFTVVSVAPPDSTKRVFPGSGFKYVIPR